MDDKNRSANRKIAALLKAVQNPQPNRDLVADGFNEHLAYLRSVWKREIRFYPNLTAAYKSDSHHTGGYTHVVSNIAKKELNRPSWYIYDKENRFFEYGYFGSSKRDALFSARVSILVRANSLAWDAIGVRGIDSFVSWQLALLGVRIEAPQNQFIPFAKVTQGGCLIFWIGRVAVHVVLATVHSQDSLVHREDGPAIQYEDGSGPWCWKGVLMPKEFVLHPEKITPEIILAEQNAETRRVMIELYGGVERFVSNVDAKVLDERDGNQLISIPVEIDGESPFVALRLRCASTDRSYILRVSTIHLYPSYRSVKRALADTFGYRNARDYKLQAET